VKVKFGYLLKDSFSSFFMGGGIRGVNKEIIHIDNEPSFSNHISEGVVHELLESGSG